MISIGGKALPSVIRRQIRGLDIRFYNDFLFIAKGILKRFFISFSVCTMYTPILKAAGTKVLQRLEERARIVRATLSLSFCAGILRRGYLLLPAGIFVLLDLYP